MTEAELIAIEARAELATPPPWVDEKGYRVRAPNSPFAEDGDVILETKHFVASSGNDCAFIAAARDDVPALIAEVRRLRGILIDCCLIEDDRGEQE